ncbi:MAG: radical SAM protein [Myxococcales bacterium]|nr:radical SAM protein [Myxococcales bacterium]
MLQVAHIVPRTNAEGPGLRAAIWTQGCTIRCPGCCNPELFGRVGGRAYAVADLLDELPAVLDGITVLGGEPLDQPEGTTELAVAAKARGLSVMVYSGYKRADVDARAPGLLAATDVLVDGPFDGSLPERGEPHPRRWIGSANQGLHFLTGRYSLNDFWGPNTVELRMVGGRVVVNGWPK